MKMTKRENVLQGLKCCKTLDTDCAHCPYMEYIYHCRKYLMKDAHAVIYQIAKERDEAIEQLRNEREKEQL